MADTFYIHRGEQEEGPFTLAQLKTFARSKLVRPDALCRPADATEWGSISDLVEFATDQAQPARGSINQARMQSEARGWLIFSLALDVLCILGLVYFVFFFDTSVRGGPGERVQNFGLLADRVIGVMISLVAGLGALLIQLAIWLKKERARS